MSPQFSRRASRRHFAGFPSASRRGEPPPPPLARAASHSRVWLPGLPGSPASGRAATPAAPPSSAAGIGEGLQAEDAPVPPSHPLLPESLTLLGTRNAARTLLDTRNAAHAPPPATGTRRPAPGANARRRHPTNTGPRAREGPGQPRRKPVREWGAETGRGRSGGSGGEGRSPRNPEAGRRGGPRSGSAGMPGTWARESQGRTPGILAPEEWGAGWSSSQRRLREWAPGDSCGRGERLRGVGRDFGREAPGVMNG